MILLSSYSCLFACSAASHLSSSKFWNDLKKYTSKQWGDIRIIRDIEAENAVPNTDKQHTIQTAIPGDLS
jgi:hypothetical protein